MMNEQRFRQSLLSPAQCKSCLAQPIQGIRYKCFKCRDTEFCSRCYETSPHADHEMVGIWLSPTVQHEAALGRQESDQTVVHNHIKCDACSMLPIVGDRFKCTQCPDFDLCGNCHAREAHQGHSLRRMQKNFLKQKVHHGIWCDACFVKPIVGIRFKCTICEDLDFCGPCRSSGVHLDHKMAMILKPSQAKDVIRLRQSGQQVRDGLVCHNCGTIPIIGDAFSCDQCPDFHLCADCKRSGMHSSHNLVAVGNEDIISPRHRKSEPIHHEIQCDSCKALPIVGFRFTCLQCHDYDLCQVCLQNGKHRHHRMQEVPLGQAQVPIHHNIVCDRCETTPIKGTRFKCTVCPDYDLCHTCFLRSAHPEHRMIEFAFGRPVNRQDSQPKLQAGASPAAQPQPSTSEENNNSSSDPMERLTCGICMDKEKNMAFGCGHSVCKECGKLMKKCPFCQTHITQRINLFL